MKYIKGANRIGVGSLGHEITGVFPRGRHRFRAHRSSIYRYLEPSMPISDSTRVERLSLPMVRKENG